MGVAIGDFTDTDKIRAAMGLTIKEVTDQQFTDLLLGIQVDYFINTAIPTAEATKTLALTIPPPVIGSPTYNDYVIAVQTYQLLQVLAMYQGAAFMMVAFQTLATQQITDGGTTLLRFAPDDIVTLLTNILSQRDRYWRILDPTFFSSTLPGLFSKVSPGYDPVTNCGSPRPAATFGPIGVGGPYGFILWRGIL